MQLKRNLFDNNHPIPTQPLMDTKLRGPTQRDVAIYGITVLHCFPKKIYAGHRPSAVGD